MRHLQDTHRLFVLFHTTTAINPYQVNALVVSLNEKLWENVTFLFSFVLNFNNFY